MGQFTRDNNEEPQVLHYATLLNRLAYENKERLQAGFSEFFAPFFSPPLACD